MKRKIIEKLAEWKSSKRRKPLLLNGARQVGKTWVLKEFGAKFFKNVAYVSLDRSRELQQAFGADCNTSRILDAISIATGERIAPVDTLVIIDEIQTVPAAITSLKYFCEDAPEYAVAAAGSLLGVSANYGSGFPVGKTDAIQMYPMSFSEFLDAIGEELLAEKLAKRDWITLTQFHERITRCLRQYYFVGGMPAAVEAFTHDSDYKGARDEQLRIIEDYRKDFAKHSSGGDDLPKIRLLWDSVPRQLARENKKFVFGAVRDGARGRDFEKSIEWLSDAGLIYRVPAVSKPNIPLSAYTTSAFKVYGLDVGLLGARCGLDVKILLESNNIFTEFKGALTEQYVQQELRSDCGMSPFYWAAENATSEIDFVVQASSSVVPIEVKAEQNLKAKSLKVYQDKFSPRASVKTSMAEYRKNNGVLSIPLYGASQIAQELRETLK